MPEGTTLEKIRVQKRKGKLIDELSLYYGSGKKQKLNRKLEYKKRYLPKKIYICK